MIISVVAAIVLCQPSSIKEVYYISSLALILASEILLSNKKVLCLIDRKIFLTAFRIKHCLCLVLIPRLWIGDQSLVLKSQIYSLYQAFFWGTTLFFTVWLALDSALKKTRLSHYATVMETSSRPNFFELKQSRFELILVICLNLAPAVILIGGPDS